MFSFLFEFEECLLGIFSKYVHGKILLFEGGGGSQIIDG